MKKTSLNLKSIGFLIYQIIILLTLIDIFKYIFSVVYETGHFTERQLILFGTLAIHNVAYWIPALFFMFVDLTGKPAFLYRYKIQPEEKVTFQMYLKCFALVIFNQLCVAVPMLWALEELKLTPYFGLNAGPEIPPVRVILRHFVFWLLFEDFWFFHVHKLLHHPLFYKYVHKVHHQFKAPVAATCEYAHPVEHFLCNVAPVVLGPWLAGSHCVELWLWMFIVIISTISHHSGYDIPFSPFGKAPIHDWHHESFKDNYGAVGLCDLLYGTTGGRKQKVKDS